MTGLAVGQTHQSYNMTQVRPQSQRISISLNGQYFGEELIVETAPNHLAS